MAQKLPFLKVDKTDIVDESGRPVLLKGVALGGWLMMEGYMLCGRNIPEREFKASLAGSQGQGALDDFTKSFRDTFIRKTDIEAISQWGANCIRVPFNYRVVELEDKPAVPNEEGLLYLDRIVEWCEEFGLYCILDMHAVPGAQNPDWHSDCSGSPRFFADAANRERYLRLWRFVADRYKDSSAVAGYDVLNEPVVDVSQEPLVAELYRKVTLEIRKVDTRHIIFLEGTDWAAKLAFLGKPADKNTAYSVHIYSPTDFTFNWVVDLHYPGKSNNAAWDKKALEALAKQYRDFMDSIETPLYVGEFGVNWRGGYYGETDWTKDILDVFRKNRFHWTYWTYKTIANSVFPDGIYRYTLNPVWVNRKGPATGWENFYTLWPKEKKDIVNSWKTENFERNDKLYSLLKKYF